MFLWLKRSALYKSFYLFFELGEDSFKTSHHLSLKCFLIQIESLCIREQFGGFLQVWTQLPTRICGFSREPAISFSSPSTQHILGLAHFSLARQIPIEQLAKRAVSFHSLTCPFYSSFLFWILSVRGSSTSAFHKTSFLIFMTLNTHWQLFVVQSIKGSLSQQPSFVTKNAFN